MLGLHSLSFHEGCPLNQSLSPCWSHILSQKSSPPPITRLSPLPLYPVAKCILLHNFRWLLIVSVIMGKGSCLTFTSLFVLVQAAFQPYLQPWTPAESLPPNSEMPAVFSLSTSIRRSPNTTSRLSSKAESFQNFLHEFSPDSSSWIGFFNCYDSMQLCLCYCPHSTLR